VVVITAATRRANIQSYRHHQQTNTHLFTGWMSFVLPNQQCQSTEVKNTENHEHISCYPLQLAKHAMSRDCRSYIT